MVPNHWVETDKAAHPNVRRWKATGRIELAVASNKGEIDHAKHYRGKAPQATCRDYRWLDIRALRRGVPAAEGVGGRRLRALHGRAGRPRRGDHHPSGTAGSA